MIARSVLAGLAAALLLVGCGGPELVLINRSDAVLTVGPGVVIPACGATTLDPDAYETAQIKGEEMASRGERWEAPDGALVWNDWGVGMSGPTRTSLVVSGVAEVLVYRGVPSDADLPVCGGAPVGIEPGVPQGELPRSETETVSP